MKKLMPGTQIIYVPSHADGIDHPDTEQGFVTSGIKKGNAVFCRYWSWNGFLRTVANSELTPVECLAIQDTHPQAEVDKLMKELYPDRPNQPGPASKTPFKDDSWGFGKYKQSLWRAKRIKCKTKSS